MIDAVVMRFKKIWSKWTEISIIEKALPWENTK